MDDKDRQLLNLIQNGFPVESRPFMVLGKQLEMNEEEVIERIKRLKEKGLIRRIGGIFNSGKMGYASTLCALQVPEERIDEVAEIINSYSGVTHNYIRKHPLNMWFTLIAASVEQVDQTIEEIRSKTSIEQVMRLPSKKVFKIKASFDMTEDKNC